MEEVQNVTVENISTDSALENFHKICRLCFSNLELKSFFKLHFEGLLLFEIYREITMLHVEEGDSLPEHICMTCIEKIVDTFIFIKNCQQTDKILCSKIANSTTEMIQQDPYEEDVDETIADRVIESDSNLDDPAVEDMQSNENHSSNFNQNLDSTNCPSGPSKLKHEIGTNKDTTIKSDLKFRKIRKVMDELPKLTGPPFICDVCNESYETLPKFKQHYRISFKCQPLIYPCNICNKRFASSHKVQLHMRTHTKEKPYKCEVCNEKFRYVQNFNRHKKGHIEEQPYACDFCEKRFTRPASKVTHMRRHTGELLPFLCTHCGKTFSTSGALKIHITNHKLENEEQIPKELPKKFLCSMCPKKYVRRSMLFLHERSHRVDIHMKKDKIKKFLCTVCGKAYATRRQLTDHATVHSKIKSYSCKICKKTFSYKTNLQNHMLIHTGERQHICSVCNRTFVQKAHLRQHMTTHTGEKPHVCQFCGKGFALKSNLMVHIRHHTGETPYHCSICNRGFYDSSSRNKHQNTHEKVEHHIITFEVNN